MLRCAVRAGGLVLAAGLLLAPAEAQALITAPTPLQGVLDQSQFIFTARVEGVDPARPALLLVAGEDLKGKAPFRKLPVNLTGDKEAAKHKHTPLLLRRVAPGLPLVLFVIPKD